MSSKKQNKSTSAPLAPSSTQRLEAAFGSIITLLDKLGTQIDETERGIERAWHYSTNAYERKLDIQVALIEQVFGQELQRLDALHRTPSDDDFIDDEEPVVHSPTAESFSEGSAVFTNSESEEEDDGAGTGLAEESEEDTDASEESFEVDSSDFSEDDEE